MAHLLDCARMGDAPAVSMLWESDDPGDALATRFGFASGTAAAEWVHDALDRGWGVTVTGCQRLVISGWNAMAWITTDDGFFIAKWSAVPQLFPRLVDVAAVTTWLDARGVPVAAPIPAKDGRSSVELGRDGATPAPSASARRFLVAVVPVVEGDLLDIDDDAHIADAGRMLAVVHEALAAYPHSFCGQRPGAGQQLVHNDFRSANILHDGREITAVLDLEIATYATRIGDLARASVFLGTRYHDWRPTPEDVRQAFVAAYEDLAPLTDAERSELRAGVDATLGTMGWN